MGTAKMHDFCMTFPYGALVALGGVIGFLAKGTLCSGAWSAFRALTAHTTRAGSVPSLVAGGGSGLALLLLGVQSLKAWRTGRPGASAPFTAASAAVAALLTYVMGKKYMLTKALFPPGVFAGLSAVMLLFYVYNLAAGGNPAPKNAPKAA